MKALPCMDHGYDATAQSALYPVPEGQVIAARYDGKVWHLRLVIRTDTTYQESIVQLDTQIWQCPTCHRGNGETNCFVCGECSACCKCWYCAGCEIHHQYAWRLTPRRGESIDYWQCRECRHCEQSCICWKRTDYEKETCFFYRRTERMSRQCYAGKAWCRDGKVRTFHFNNADNKTDRSRLGVNEVTVQAKGKKVRGIIEIKRNVITFVPFADSPHKDVITQKGKKAYIYKVSL